MKKIFLGLAVAFAFWSANVQATPAKQDDKPAPVKTEVRTTAKPATKTGVKATPAQTSAETKVVKAETKTTVKTEKKPADARTKTGDKVYRDKKGPKGETVYVGPKGGFYYLDKKENKVYIK